MKLDRLVTLLLALVGTGFVGCGAYAPLVTVPVVGAVRFSENNLGGEFTAGLLIFSLVISSVLLALGGLTARLGVIIASLSLGMFGGVLLSIYRHAMDQVMQIADLGDGKMDEGISKLLAQMQYGSGALWSVVGSMLILTASAICLFKDRPSTHYSQTN